MGGVDRDCLSRVLSEVVRRHEVLRTRFELCGDEVVQRIDAPWEVALVVQVVHVDGLEQAVRQAGGETFDLERDRLLRAHLLRLGEHEHVLVLAMHHIVADGWSSGVLVREVAQLYEALVAGDPSPLPALAVQYADYAVWQRQWLQGDVLQRQLDYWITSLAGAPAALDLPTDHARPPEQSYRGAMLRFRLPAELGRQLREVARCEGVTLYMLLLAAFNVLLSRWSGQDDIVVGSPIANRTHRETEELIGFFVNTLPLRTRLAPGATFQALLRQVRETTLGAYAYQDLPFEKLVDALQPERNLSRSPVFQVLFTMENAPLEAFELPGGLRLAAVDLSAADSAKFDLSLDMAESAGTAGELYGEFEYSIDLFERSTIERLAGHFKVLCEAIVAHPQIRLDELPLLTEAERVQLLEQWSRAEQDFQVEQTYAALFAHQAATHPERIAAVCAGASLSYRELDRHSTCLAHALITAGAGPNTLVVVLGERDLWLLTMMVAVLKAGAAMLPLEVNHPAERLREIVQSSGASLLLHTSATSPLREQIVTGDTGLRYLIAEETCEETAALAETALPASGTLDDLAYVIFTSGSTGKPKGAMVEQRGMLNNMLGKVPTVGLNRDDRVAQTASPAFDICVWQFLAAGLVGGTVHILPDAITHDPLQLLAAVERERISLLEIVPSLMRAMLDACPAGSELRSLRWVLPTGEALPLKMAQDWFERFPYIPLMNVYGPAECSDDVAFHAITARPHDHDVIPIGRPTPNNRLFIVDGQLRPVPVGVHGEICVAGMGVGRGYLHDEQQTRAVFVAHPFAQGERFYRTGDIGRYRADGVIEFIERRDYQVKIRGYRIELGEIEAALARHPHVGAVVVAAHRYHSGEKGLVAYVVAKEGARSTAAQLRAHLAQSLPEYMVPSAFVQLEALPLTPNGKIDRKCLPGPGDMQFDETDYAVPRTSTEELLADIWAEMLNIDRVGIHDNFFTLGGHSLLATRMLVQMRHVLGVELPARSVFETPTVAELAERIVVLQRQGAVLALPPLMPRARGTRVPLSFAQLRLWFLDQYAPGTGVYNIPTAWRIKGPLDFVTLERSLNEIIRRHEALRTTFNSEAGDAEQVIASEGRIELTMVDLSHGENASDRPDLLINSEAKQSFDLARGPLIRASLFRLTEQEHIFLLTVHHVIADGWSIGVLVRELNVLYRTYGSGHEPVLARLPVQYADFAIWQKEWLQGDLLQEQLDYWKRTLEGAPPVLELPTDRPRPAMLTHQGALFKFNFGAKLSLGLQQLSQSSGTTLFMVAATAFNVLLHRYSRQDDICIGYPVANRNRHEIEGLIGFFVNTLVLRTRLRSEQSFLSLLQQVKEALLDADAHQDLPFEKLVEELRPERNLSHSALFQVMLAMDNTAEAELDLPGIESALVEGGVGLAKFDLTLNIAQRQGQLHAVFEYNTDLFDEPTIARMAGHCCMLLEAIVVDPQTRIKDLPLLSEVERRQVLVEWNTTRSEFPTGRCVHELFEEQVARCPEAVAVVFEDRQLTYGELNARSNQLAHYLRDLGVEPDMLVAICVERSLEMVVGLLGILKAGAAYVPLDPEYPPERLAYMLEDTVAQVLLTQGHLEASLPKHACHWLRLDQDWGTVAQYSALNPPAVASPQHLAYCIYTSGSTGRPKGAMNSHGGVVNRLLWMQQQYRMDEQDRVLQKTPFSFDVSVWEFFWPLLCGARLVMAVPGGHQDASYLAQVFGSAAITVTHFVPSMLQAFLELPTLSSSADRLRLVFCSGEALPYAVCQRFLEQFPATELHNLYGPTEAAVDVTYWHCRPDNLRGKVLIGRPVANTQIYIVDASMSPVPIGVPGAICIGGVQVARGYLNRPDLTAEKFVPDPYGEPGSRMYWTGDLGRHLPDGSIEFLGRIDHQVKIRGFRIELGEIESTLLQCEGVREAAVLAREDSSGDKQLVAYIVGNPEAGLSTVGMKSILQSILPKYMLPASYVFLEGLPLNANGKLDRNALPAPERLGAREGYVAPRNSTEEGLAAIWAEVLRVDRVGVFDNFFELGGHSLLATRLALHVRRALNVDLPLRTIFEAPDVAGLATQIKIMMEKVKYADAVAINTESESGLPSAVLVQPGRIPVNLFCSPSIGGGVPTEYRQLGKAMDISPSIYCFTACDFKTRRLPLESTIEELSKSYVDEILSVQPEGPYFLCGYSAGGVIAFEMARQLALRGKEIGLLAMVDTTTENRIVYPAFYDDEEKKDWYDFFGILGRELVRAVAPTHDAPFWSMPDSERIAMVFQVSMASGMAPSNIDIEDLRYLFTVSRAMLRIFRGYLPGEYVGDIDFFLQLSTEDNGSAGEIEDNLGFWRSRIEGELRITRVNGNHQTMMMPPNVNVIAKVVSEAILGGDASTNMNLKCQL
ncbi:D-alanine--poly(phosphoribitol) ligase, subunit 1 [Collimonas fungivorans]|uniref:D-alanine--poly(Phosphoribitol) ligase, subunit 1 n=2 Tax=Collimonas fungivorans TaxID=158899 RepID=A0A127P688_9BURK|nr:D-alanine--poly(phosphoribitol) ligase, subunit 1 [Collimonas fungivorans]